MKEEALIEQSWPRTALRRFSPKILLIRALEAVTSLGWTLGGVSILLVVWAIVSANSQGALPGPVPTLKVLGQLVSHPFYDNGPNDKGIGLQLVNSIGRVFVGFTLGSLVAIPIGIAMGSSEPLRKLFNPLVQLLRPVSPLAWFPIGLAVFKHAGEATIFVIFITSLWATLINTAAGVAAVPEDHRNVARAFGFSRNKYLTKILIPFALPYIFTGLRLSLGVAWLVIVAGEMLSGGMGIGFFVWDSWNALSLERVMSAILLIGTVGLILDRLFDRLVQRFAYE
jgi:nitrate/nitrite transport system permease protein